MFAFGSEHPVEEGEVYQDFSTRAARHSVDTAGLANGIAVGDGMAKQVMQGRIIHVFELQVAILDISYQQDLVLQVSFNP